MAIPKIYKYGVEITKPWSQEMYDFNENIKDHMLNRLRFAIKNIADIQEAQKMSKIINPYGYGEGYTLDDMKKDMLKNADQFENFWFAQIWDQLIEANFVEPIFGAQDEVYSIIGFESREEILKLREKYSTETI